jgi:hypothetical protein
MRFSLAYYAELSISIAGGIQDPQATSSIFHVCAERSLAGKFGLETKDRASLEISGHEKACIVSY